MVNFCPSVYKYGIVWRSKNHTALLRLLLSINFYPENLKNKNIIGDLEPMCDHVP